MWVLIRSEALLISTRNICIHGEIRKILKLHLFVLRFYGLVNPMGSCRAVSLPNHTFKVFFVCVEVLRPSQPNGVMSSGVSLPNHTLLGRLSPLSG